MAGTDMEGTTGTMITVLFIIPTITTIIIIPQTDIPPHLILQTADTAALQNHLR